MNSYLAGLLVVTATFAATSPAFASSKTIGKVDALETAAIKVETELLAPWKRAWLAGDAKAFSALFAPKARVHGWDAAREKRREVDGIVESDWKAAAPRDASAADLSADAARYLKTFARVEDLSLQVVDEPADQDGAAYRVRYDLRGLLPDGSRRTDRGLLTLRAVETPKGRRIGALEIAVMETLTARRPVFVDETRASGLASIPVEPRLEAIRRGGYALAIGDLNADGLPDLYVGRYGPGRLFLNRGDGRFEDATKAAGLEDDTLVKAAAIADLDNDGRPDLTLQRFVAAPKEELKFYRNLGGGTFAAQPARVTRVNAHDRAMSMAAGDFNDDGRVDLYVGYPGTKDFTDGRPDPAQAPGTAAQAVYLNDGKWAFHEAVDPAQPRMLGELIRPHSALATDADRDGKMDLLIVDDRGYTSRLYLNRGDGKFAPSTVPSGIRNQGWGMMAASGDYDGDGLEDVYFSNIDFNAGHRFLRLAEREGIHLDDVDLPRLRSLNRVLQGNALYRSMGDGTFVETTLRAGVGYAGEAPGGSEWIDYNGDGLLDLYVVNGLWSDAPDADYTTTFLREQLHGGAGSVSNPAAAEADNPLMRELQRTGQSMAGYQRNRLFRNDGNGSFTEVGYLTGADRIEDGYIAGFADYDADGKLDMILRNADAPSLKRPFAPVTVLRNAGASGGSLAVYLKRKGGHEPFGSRVTVTANGRTQTREMRAVQGAVQNESVAFFGLGAAKHADQLEVRWPNGEVERFENLKPGRLVIEEGSSKPSYLSMSRID